MHTLFAIELQVSVAHIFILGITGNSGISINSFVTERHLHCITKILSYVHKIIHKTIKY